MESIWVMYAQPSIAFEYRHITHDNVIRLHQS